MVVDRDLIQGVARSARRWLAAWVIMVMAGCGGTEPGGTEGGNASHRAPSAGKAVLAVATALPPETIRFGYLCLGLSSTDGGLTWR